MSKPLKSFLLVLSAALITAACIFGGIKLREKIILNKAESLYAAGEYAEARARYELLEMEEGVAACDRRLDQIRLDEAKALMESGELEAARAEFEALGEFEDAADMVCECDLRKASALYDAGNYDDAVLMLERIEEYPPAAEFMGCIREELYDEALEATYACRMDEAIMLWNRLGDYKDSGKLLKRCMNRVVSMANGGAEPVTTGYGVNLAGGKLYYHRLGLVYVPKECSADTPFLIFYPGGYDTSLANAYITEFIYSCPPDAVMLFCYTNGYYDMQAKIEDSYQVLEQTAAEQNLFIRDLVLCGASMGSYTALNAAAYLHETYGIDAQYVLSFDAGGYWEVSDHVLTAAQSDSVAEAGTKLMLFEGDNIGMNKTAIQVMVLHDVDTTIVHCRNYGHYQIIYDAMGYGMMHWALGRGDLPDTDNYTYIHLDRSSAYPN